MSYFDELKLAMTFLGKQEDTLFLGQSVAFPGNAIYRTLSGIPSVKRIELPVAEQMQMGMSIGLSLAGKTVISIYPRMNFLMCAMNQLVNHLDKLESYSNGEFIPKVIVRVCVGSETPLDPGLQHKGDYPIHLDNIPVIRLQKPEDILPAYQEAYNSKRSTLLIEYGDLYNT
jgi:pyruvate/2-oxoglutarate/acetoin dehydrogenase E1 component